MYSEALETQDFAVRLLRAHLQNGNLAHSYMLTGQNSPKTELARAFAAGLNCEKQRYFQECDCNPCHKFETENHPDIHIYGEDLKVKSIKIDEVRNMIEQAGFKPYEGKWKVFILLQAGRLTPDASNALLKTLEEPPAHTLFILTAESKMQFLETIQSRCFEIRMRPGAAALSEISALTIADKKWEDFFEEQSAGHKEEIKTTIDGLMAFLRRQLAESPAPDADARRLKAIDYLIETKDALDANVNAKLAMTRLAVHFRRLNPEKAGV